MDSSEIYSVDAVYKALSKVYDPELDEPITRLGFVREVKIGDSVEVVISTSTYWCSPNFIYMILEDARREISRALGIDPKRVRVYIRGHHDENRINDCVNRGERFENCYRSETWRGKEDLYRIFLEKRLIRRLYGFIKIATRYGLSLQEIAGLRRGDVIDLEDLIVIRSGSKEIRVLDSSDIAIIRSYVSLVKELIPAGEDLVIGVGSGKPIVEELETLLRTRGRSIDLGFTLNSELCRLLLESRISREAGSL